MNNILTNEEVEILLELLERTFEGYDFLCSEMSDNEDEWNICADTCDYSSPQRECFIRYSKMRIRNKGGDDT